MAESLDALRQPLGIVEAVDADQQAPARIFLAHALEHVHRLLGPRERQELVHIDADREGLRADGVADFGDRAVLEMDVGCQRGAILAVENRRAVIVIRTARSRLVEHFDRDGLVEAGELVAGQFAYQGVTSLIGVARTIKSTGQQAA